MVIKKRARTFEEKLLAIYGFLGTMPIIEFFGFTVFTWLSLAILLYALITKRTIPKPSRPVRILGLITVILAVSTAVCFTGRIPQYWKTMARNHMIWQLVYFLVLMYYLSRNRIRTINYYIKGVYYAAVVHSVWGILQLLVYSVSKISINKLLFYDILGVEMAEYVQMRGNSIAITGFCWNAGNLAPLIVIGFVLSPSIYSKLFFLFVTVISGSRTAIVGILVCVIVEYGIRLFKHLRKRIKKRTMFIILLILAGAAGVVIIKQDMVSSLMVRVQEMITSFSGDTLTTQASSRIHTRYWTSIPKVTGWNDLIHNLIGYGPGCSGYPFAAIFDQFSDHAWTVECDFIKNLWEMGYIGFIVWYGWYGMSIVRGMKIDKKYLYLFAGLLAEGVTYNVTFNWCYILVIILFANIWFGIDIFDGIKSRKADQIIYEVL